MGVEHQAVLGNATDTVDGRNPANQLRLVVYPIVYKALYIPGGWEWDFFHQQYVCHERVYPSKMMGLEDDPVSFWVKR